MYNAAKVRALNDEFRNSFRGGRVVATPGVLTRPDVITILDKVKTFTEFDVKNDPHAEHDFGSFVHDGRQIFWKLDYYAVDLNQGSPDPGDSAVTTRVLTVMLADEY